MYSFQYLKKENFQYIKQAESFFQVKKGKINQ